MKRWLIFLVVEVFAYVGGIILMRIGDGFTNLGNVFLLCAIIVPVVAWARARGETITRIRTKFYRWMEANPRMGYTTHVLILIFDWSLATVSCAIYLVSPHQLWVFLILAITLLVLPLVALLQRYD